MTLSTKLVSLVFVIFNYYGLDWLAMALSLIAMYLIGNKNKFGFIVLIASNILWIIVSLVFMNSYGILIGSSIFFFINLRGFLNWESKNKLENC
ncbi:hypothetical protein WAF17_13315 [Bernardetia sp. ABR2-2B]|uniref:hypothetical protein n=1 Tax=Bernardetia sp. ABR2-2B TaxID=3127472 RepID=UPI0030D4E447